MNRYLFTAAAGAAAMYFLDPELGARRRKQAREQAERMLRRVDQARGAVERARARQPSP